MNGEAGAFLYGGNTTILDGWSANPKLAGNGPLGGIWTRLPLIYGRRTGAP
jgi:hypothetical protein